MNKALHDKSYYVKIKTSKIQKLKGCIMAYRLFLANDIQRFENIDEEYSYMIMKTEVPSYRGFLYNEWEFIKRLAYKLNKEEG